MTTKSIHTKRISGLTNQKHEKFSAKSYLTLSVYLLYSSTRWGIFTVKTLAHESGLGLPIRHIKKLQNKLAASTPNGNDLSLSVKSVNQTEKQSG